VFGTNGDPDKVQRVLDASHDSGCVGIRLGRLACRRATGIGRREEARLLAKDVSHAEGTWRYMGAAADPRSNPLL